MTHHSATIQRREKTRADAIDALLDERVPLDVRLHQALGDDGFFSLLQAYGGTRLYVPRQRTAGSELTNVLTVDQIETLSLALGGSYLRVPLCREFLIVQFTKRGYSTRDIALQFRMTESGVERMKMRFRARGKLLDVPAVRRHRPFKSVMECLPSIASEAVEQARQKVLSGALTHIEIMAELKADLKSVEIKAPDANTIKRWLKHVAAKGQGNE